MLLIYRKQNTGTSSTVGFDPTSDGDRMLIVDTDWS
jgi:hypothetical protein